MFIKLLSFRSAVVDHPYIISALSSLFGHSNIYQNVSIVYSAHFPSFTFSLWFNLKILVRTKMQVKSCFWLFQKINNVSNYLKSILRKVNVGLEDKESYSSQAQSYLDAVCTIQSQSLPCLLTLSDYETDRQCHLITISPVRVGRNSGLKICASVIFRLKIGQRVGVKKLIFCIVRVWFENLLYFIS